MMRALLALAGVALALAACSGNDGATPSPSREPTPLCTDHTPDPASSFMPAVVFDTEANVDPLLRVEVADDPAERQAGLSNRDCLLGDWGMLFVNETDVTTGFWMKDTRMPLSIAFISGDGTILHIEDMAALSEELHAPPGPYRYAIEVNRGWFEGAGVEAGQRVEFPESLTP